MQHPGVGVAEGRQGQHSGYQGLVSPQLQLHVQPHGQAGPLEVRVRGKRQHTPCRRGKRRGVVRCDAGGAKAEVTHDQVPTRPGAVRGGAKRRVLPKRRRTGPRHPVVGGDTGAVLVPGPTTRCRTVVEPAPDRSCVGARLRRRGFYAGTRAVRGARASATVAAPH